MYYNKKLINILLKYCAFLLCYNEFISLYLSKWILRGTYVAIILILIIQFLFKSKGKIYFNKTDSLIAIYAFYAAIRFIVQIIAGNTTYSTFLTFFQLFVPLLIYFISIYIAEDNAIKIENAFVIFASISALVGAIDRFYKILPSRGSFAGDLYGGVGGGVYVARGYSLAGSALITGFMCSLGLCFIISNYKVKDYHSKIYLPSFVALLIGLFSALSRGAFFMFVIFLICLLLTNARSHEKRLMSRNQFLIGLIVFFSLVIIVIFNYDSIINSNFFGRIVRAGLNLNEHSNSLRVGFQKNAFEKLRNNLLFGKGFGFVGVQAINLNASESINTESYLLSLIADGGLVMMILFVLIVINALVIAFRQPSRAVSGYISIVIGIFIWSILYIVLDSDLNGVFFWYCFARIFQRDGEFEDEVFSEKRLE